MPYRLSPRWRTFRCHCLRCCCYYISSLLTYVDVHERAPCHELRRLLRHYVHLRCHVTLVTDISRFEARAMPPCCHAACFDALPTSLFILTFSLFFFSTVIMPLLSLMRITHTCYFHARHPRYARHLRALCLSLRYAAVDTLLPLLLARFAFHAITP